MARVATCRRQAVALLTAALLAAWPVALPAQPAAEAAISSVPFGQTLDMAKVRAATRSAPTRLLATIAALGVDVLRVSGAAPGQAPNPLLAGLPLAPPEVLREAEFRDSYEGRVVLRHARCCGLLRDTILIRDTASNYTLLHEFVHTLLPPSRVVVEAVDFELAFATAFRRLWLYHCRLCEDPARLLDPRWRRDLLAALDDVVPMLFERIRMGQSQEAIVEKVLAREIDSRSPYHDAARREQGRLYGERAIDNAIDLFNTTHEAIIHAEQSVRQLREALTAGQLEPAGADSLTVEEQRAFEQQLREAARQLEPVRVEIEALKRFFALP